MNNKENEFNMTEEELKQDIRDHEEDYLMGLLDAADDADTDTICIDISRKGRKYFSFSIHSLTEEQLNEIRKKYTKYAKNRRQGIKVAEELDTAKYRSSVIYNSTIKADQEKLWNNKEVQENLRKKGKRIINALDVIDAVLLPGEKDRIMEIIDEMNGYGNEEVKTATAKN